MALCLLHLLHIINCVNMASGAFHNVLMPPIGVPMYLIIFLMYMLLIFVLQRKHEQFLDKVPYPRNDSEAHTITFRFMYQDFPFICNKSLEFGLFKTYAIPSISFILSRTRELIDRCPRRYDDTDIILREITEHPPHSQRARRALERMNAIHAPHRIRNEDYLYVLSVFIVEPIRWARRYGYRQPHPKESFAMHLRWKVIGEQMGIKNIPPNYENTEAYLDDYEEKHMVYADSNVRVGRSTVNLFLSVIPTVFHPLCLPVIFALCPPRLRRAMGFPTPSMILVSLIDMVLRVAGVVVRYLLPPRINPKIRTSSQPLDCDKGVSFCPLFNPYEPIYANGYKIEELGPPCRLPKKDKKRL